MSLASRREFLARLMGLALIGTHPSSAHPRAMSRFGMFGRLTAHAGRRDELVAHLLRAARLLSEAPGCELYVVNTSPTEPDDIWVFEAWRSKSDHEASLFLPAIRELITEARPLIAATSDSTPLVPVGGRGLDVG